MEGLNLIVDDAVKLKLVEEIIRDNNSTKKEQELAKQYLFNRIKKKIRAKNEAMINNLYYIKSTDISHTIQVPLVEANVERNKIVSSWIKPKRCILENNLPLVFREDQKNVVYFNSKFDVNMEKKEIEQDLGFTISNNHQFPFGYTIFEERSYDVDHDLNFSSDGYVTYTNKINLKNFLYKPSLDFFITPSFNYQDGLAVQEIDIGINHVNETKRLYSSVKVCPISRSLSSNIVYRPKNNEKIVTSLTIKPKSITLAGVYFINMSNYHSYSFSMVIRNSLISFGNFFLIHKGNNVLELNSTLNLFKNNGNLNLNASLSIIFKISRFKIQIPIIVSSMNSPYTLFCFFLSTVLGHSLLFLRRTYKKFFNKNRRLFEDKSRKKQIDFNEANKYEMEMKTEEERKENGLIINYAFFGEKEKIEEIYKNIMILGQYRNNDMNVYDIRPALILGIHENKLVIPKNISSFNGVYEPCLNQKKNLFYVISYKYRIIQNTIIVQNGTRIVNLP